MKSFLIIVIGFLAVSCTTNSPSYPESLDYSKRFKVPYETLWRATQQALLNYPMNINNMDTGHLQTLYITGKHRFQAPHKKDEPLPSGYQYRLNVNIIKGEEVSKVVILKEVRLQKDFFSDPEELISDGYEEKAIIYRIRREIIMEKILKKQMEKKPKPKS